MGGCSNTEGGYDCFCVQGYIHLSEQDPKCVGKFFNFLFNFLLIFKLKKPFGVHGIYDNISAL